MTHRAAVVGASGYTGAELLRLLAGHPAIDVVAATADSNAGAAVTDLFPSLLGAYAGVELTSLEASALDGLDLAFLCLPHGESQRVVPELVGRVGHVIDLGADFRLPADVYKEWYGDAHGAPDLLDAFAYGLPELYRDEITGAAHVASPGCYPTAAALALAPLLATGLAATEGIVVNAVSGLSGAGRKLTATSLFSEADENVSPYGLLTHRHTGEIDMVLSHVHGRPVEVLFTPHLVPMTRGILATCYARSASDGLTSARLLDVYHEHYDPEPFVLVNDAPPVTKSTVGSNACQVTVRYDDRTGTILAIAAIDNLVKGASGQAIQAANRVLDLPETTGLPVIGLMP